MNNTYDYDYQRDGEADNRIRYVLGIIGACLILVAILKYALEIGAERAIHNSMIGAYAITGLIIILSTYFQNSSRSQHDEYLKIDLEQIKWKFQGNRQENYISMNLVKQLNVSANQLVIVNHDQPSVSIPLQLIRNRTKIQELKEFVLFLNQHLETIKPS